MAVNATYGRNEARKGKYVDERRNFQWFSHGTVTVQYVLRLLPKKGFRHAERDCLRSEVSS